MKQRFVMSGVAAQAQAQTGGRQGEANAQAPRRNGVPDFSGIWVPTPKRGELPDAFDPKNAYKHLLYPRARHEPTDMPTITAAQNKISVV